MAETKPRDVQVLPIALDTIVLRSRSWTRLRFEIEYALQRGTTANSYLILAEKTALIDPPGESFTEIYLTQLQQLASGSKGSNQTISLWSSLWSQLRWVTQQYVDLEQLDFDLKRLDYVILGHVNPNRAVTLKALLELVPQITFVCSNPGAIVLRAALPDHNLKIQVVRGEETLDLGKGHRLQFIPTPSPRWPDRLCTYDPQTQVLFTDKLFGAHVCGDQVFDEGWQVFAEDRRYYYDCLMAPDARQTETALERLAPLSVRFYAPGHGPIVRDGLTELTHAYQRWNQEQKIQDLSVALLFASAYGNTATLGQAIARGITKAGIGVESINCEVASSDEITAAVEKCDGFIIGSPTITGHAPTPIQTALGIILSTVPKSKPAGVFGSYGWSGEAIDLIEGKLRDAGYQFGFETIRVKFTPTDVTLQFCEEAGTDFAQALKKARKTRETRKPSAGARQDTSALKDSQTDPTVQAVGRIVDSLCVVTAKQGDVASAMLASWVSQATFKPPGLTVAVAKDRAIESLTHSGGQFVLNILAEESHLGLMKHFLKPFGPGEDRFLGVNTQEASNGSPILKDASAFLECRIESRMETGDHWIVYAVVENGKVLKPNALTAIHHRKSGSYY